MLDEKIKEVLGDKELLGSLLHLETAQEVVDFLKEKGFNYTLDDVTKIKDLIMGKNGELDENELGTVAGGSSLTDFSKSVLSDANEAMKFIKEHQG